MSKKKSTEIKETVLPLYEAPFINEDAECAMLAYRRIGYVDGISTCTEGKIYSMLVADRNGDLGLTTSDVIYSGGKFMFTHDNHELDQCTIVAVKENG